MKMMLIILFNIVEMIVVYLTGMLLNLPHEAIVIIMLLFIITRMTLGKPLHYKSPYRCFIMTLLVFLSMFVLFKINIYVSIMFTIFDAFLLTGKGNIKDMFMWSGKTSKHEEVFEFIKYNKFDERLLNFEKVLKEQDNLSYLIYKYRFKENMTFEQISEKLDIDNPRISEIQDNVAFALRIALHI